MAASGLMPRLGRLKVGSFSEMFHMVMINQSADHVNDSLLVQEEQAAVVLA